MPLTRSKDSTGPYYRWGGAGTKCHYTSADAASRNRAKAKALRQGRAAAARRGGAAKKPKPLTSAARAKRKVEDRKRAQAVAAYRRAGKGV